MDWRNPRSIERGIARLQREIAEIDDYFYGAEVQARDLVLGMLERKRDDIVRAAVLQLHTGIEDVLIACLLQRMLELSRRQTPNQWRAKLRTDRGKTLRRILEGPGSIGFDTKLHLAVGVGLISRRMREQLAELNSIRNKCAHNWELNAKIRRGRRPRQTKPPLLNFRGQDLHRVSVLKGFIAEYSRLYVRLFLKSID